MNSRKISRASRTDGRDEKCTTWSQNLKMGKKTLECTRHKSEENIIMDTEQHKKFHTFHGVWRFIIYHVLKIPCYILSYAIWLQSTPPSSFNNIYFNTYQQCLGNLIFGEFPTKMLCISFSPACSKEFDVQYRLMGTLHFLYSAGSCALIRNVPTRYDRSNKCLYLKFSNE
jgi:hypothetical protein